MPKFPPPFYEALEAAERRSQPINPDIVDGLAWRFTVIKSMDEPSAFEDMTLAERRHIIDTSWKQIRLSATNHAQRTGTPEAKKLLIHFAARQAKAVDHLARLLSN